MTLLNIITAAMERFPDVSGTEICLIVNELESRLIDEIFSPSGISVRTERLDPETDLNTALLLGEENILLYVYFIFSVLSLRELDFNAANAFSTVFNEKFSELSVFYRRNNPPVKKTVLSGGI